MGSDGWMSLHRWVFAQQAFREHLGLGLGGETGADNRFLESVFGRTGVSIMGKKMFDEGERGWPEEPPFHSPIGYRLDVADRQGPFVRAGIDGRVRVLMRQHFILIALAVAACQRTPSRDPNVTAADPMLDDALVGTTPGEWTTEHWRNSEPLTLEALRGRVVLVRWFMSTECPYCTATAPALRAIHEDYAARGVVVVSSTITMAPLRSTWTGTTVTFGATASRSPSLLM